MRDTTLKNNVNRTFKMRDYTIAKYKEVIDIAMRKSLRDGFILRSYFEALAKNFKMSYAILTYLQRLDVIKKIGENKFGSVNKKVNLCVNKKGNKWKR